LTVEQVVVTRLLSVPGVQLPAATKLGPVVTLLQVTEVKPLPAVGVTGVQLPAAAGTVERLLLQTVAVCWLVALAATSVQDPGATAVTGLLLLVQVVTV
jgi:hypothetical protein